MTISNLSGALPGSRGRFIAWLRKVPAWPIALFSAAIAIVYAPNVIHVFGIHTDYENLLTRSPYFFHPESGHLFAVARPVAALFTNVTMAPVRSLADYRWTRLFSILTVCVLGTQMIRNCVLLLRVRVRDAAALAIAVFVIPAFTYSNLVAAAWAPHLLTPLIAFTAYAVLGRSNLFAVPLGIVAARRDYVALYRQVPAYCAAPAVWGAAIVFQVALYDYPPSALIVTVFPIIGILFSQAPRPHRTLIAFRDIGFVGANLVLYFVSVKLIYLPIVRLFITPEIDSRAARQSAFVARLAKSYEFHLDTRIGDIVGRLGNLIKVAGDLWFVPQTRFYLVVGAALALAMLAAKATASPATMRAGSATPPYVESIARLDWRRWNSEGAIAFYVLTACFVVAGSPMLAAAGGFITYRTIAMSTAVAAIAFIFATRGIIETLAGAVAGKAFGGKAADGAMGLIVLVAVISAFYTNYVTMKLARNEFAYFTDVARQAIATEAKTVFLIDRRPLILPDQLPLAYDEHGRALPPYEIGCLSSYCIQSGAILHIAIEMLGKSDRDLQILTPQGNEPVPGLTCAMLTGPRATYPADASARSKAIIDYYRTLTPLTCIDYSTAWHDLGIDLAKRQK